MIIISVRMYTCTGNVSPSKKRVLPTELQLHHYTCRTAGYDIQNIILIILMHLAEHLMHQLHGRRGGIIAHKDAEIPVQKKSAWLTADDLNGKQS